MGLFHQITGGGNSLLSVQCPGNGSLPRTVSPIVSDPYDPETQSPSATGARCSGSPCVDYTHTGRLGRGCSGAAGGGRAFDLGASAGSREITQGTSTRAHRAEEE